MLGFEVVEGGTRGDHVLEQAARKGDVPPAVSQLVDEAALGLVRRDVERLEERIARISWRTQGRVVGVSGSG